MAEKDDKAVKDALAFVNKFEYKKKERISSGVLPLDIILNKGFELGGCYAIASPPGGGKTTLVLQICKYLCDQGRFCVFADIEQGLKEEQLEGPGLDKYLEPINGESTPRLTIINTLYSYSDFQNYCRSAVLLKQKGVRPCDIIFSDSLSTLVPETILNGDCEAATVAADARPLSKLIKSVRPVLGVAGITMFNIVQAGSNIGAGQWDPKWVAKVTKAIEHAVDGLILLEHPTAKSYQIYGKKKTPAGEVDVEIGYYGKLYTTKARSALNRIKLMAPLIAGVGCDNVQYLMNSLLDTGVFVKGSKYYKYNDANGVEQRLTGETEFKQFVSDNYTMLVQMMYDLGFYDLTNNSTVDKIAIVEPAEISGAEVSQEELNNEQEGTVEHEDAEQFI